MAETFEDFGDQFILARGSRQFPPQWKVREHAGWFLATHPHLPVLGVEMGSGVTAGWLLGYPIADGRLMRGGEVLRLEEPLDEARLEDQLYRVGGRFAFVLPDEKISRLYLDPFGTLSATYSTESHVLASTTTLIEWVESRGNGSFPDRREHGANKPTLAPNHFYPAGLTHNPKIRRLLPNHYLDLGSWQVVRHWPKGRFEQVAEGEIEGQVETIVGALRSTIGAVTSECMTYLPLTSGRDSRMLLACAKESLEKVRFVTFDYGESVHSDIDTHTALRLGRTFRLDHILVPIEPAASDDEANYLFRIGYSGNPGKARDFYKACAQHLDSGRAWLTGFAGGIGRANYWSPDLAEIDGRLSSLGLIARLDLSGSQPTKAAMEEWVSGLPELDAWSVMDLLFLEQRVGCWSSPHLYGVAPFRLNLLPFCDRRIVDASLRLPISYRSRKQLADDMIALAWPELGAFPYHSFTGMRRIWDLRPMWKPGVRSLARAASKLKRMVVVRNA